jgi:hypothetical protein
LIKWYHELMEIENAEQIDNRSPEVLASQVKKIFDDDGRDMANPERHSKAIDTFFSYDNRSDTAAYTKEAIKIMKRLVAPDGHPVEPQPQHMLQEATEDRSQYLKWDSISDKKSWTTVVDHVILNTVQQQSMADYRPSKGK